MRGPLRPTIGLVPNDGLITVSWTFYTIGPVARSAKDCSLLLEALAPEYRPDPDGPAPRIGLVAHLLERADPRIAALVEEAARSLGAEIVEAPDLDQAGLIQQLIMLSEAATYHLPWLRTRLADYGPDVRARLLAGLALPITAYPTGVRGRRWLSDRIAPLFERYDLLAAPTMRPEGSRRRAVTWRAAARARSVARAGLPLSRKILPSVTVPTRRLPPSSTTMSYGASSPVSQIVSQRPSLLIR